MFGIDAKPIMAPMADNIDITRYGPVKNAVDKPVCSDLPSMEADLSRSGSVGNDAASFGCRAPSEKRVSPRTGLLIVVGEYIREP
ncbi:MAG: hypothetical protein COA53_02505 [Rhodobacteraceae bacterium]|nr:MAG: hypothetical protein COA53_02505 [Paracoccaceae bacterium]